MIAMNLQEVEAFIGERKNEMPVKTLMVLSEVFVIINKVYRNSAIPCENGPNVAMKAATAIALGDMNLSSYIDMWTDKETPDDCTDHANFLGAFLVTAKLNKEILINVAERYGMTRYLINKTILDDLSIDQWHSHS